MGFGPRIGERSTHEVKCVVCDQTFPNAGGHDCAFTGVRLRKRIEVIESRLEWLESFHDSVPATSTDQEKA